MTTNHTTARAMIAAAVVEGRLGPNDVPAWTTAALADLEGTRRQLDRLTAVPTLLSSTREDRSRTARVVMGDTLTPAERAALDAWEQQTR